MNRESLYKPTTWAPTERLDRLKESDEALTKDDVEVLFAVYCEGCENAGVKPDLVDFGSWLAGANEYREVGFAEVVW